VLSGGSSSERYSASRALLGLVSALFLLLAFAAPAGAATYVKSYGGPSSLLFAGPESLAVDLQGNIFVASPFGAGFNKLDSGGNQIFLHSSLGNGPGQFVNGPNGTATDSSGNAYFTDECTANSCCPAGVDCDTVDRVEVFDGNGSFLRAFGTPGSGNGQFEQPRGLATDAARNLYVADSNNDRIEKFNSSGGYVDQWSGGLSEPQGVAVDGSGKVFVTDVDHVRVFTSSGGPVTSWAIDEPRGIAVDRAGHVYVADQGNDRVQVFDSSGSFVSSFGGSGGGPGRFLSGPEGVALDCSGHIYVSDPGNNRVQVWSEPGAGASACGAPSSGPSPGQSASTAAKKHKCKKKKRKHRSASASKKRKCKKKKHHQRH
jgi:sugar lactone lactonase YvrE